jgi:glycosyltransferase involved in cell wall biosynthesis
MVKPINWIGYYSINDGYAYLSIKLIKELIKLGAEIAPMTLEQAELWDTELFLAAGYDLNRLLIHVGVPADSQQDQQLIVPPHFKNFAGRIWCYTMYEGDKLLNNWVHVMNTRTERVLVPSQWCKDVFEQSGVKSPVHIVLGGVDPNVYYPSVTPFRPYTFMTIGDRGNRKGWTKVWAAFHDAFGDNPDVRLIVKTREPFEAHNDLTTYVKDYMTDSRVTFLRGNFPNMRDVYLNADCFVFPSSGEGFGLPPREAAACGLPTIVTNYSGLNDETEHWAYPIDYKLVNSQMAAGGSWAHPNQEQLRERMLWCYENQDTAHEFGIKASQWLHQNRTWSQSAKTLYNLLDNQDNMIKALFEAQYVRPNSNTNK